MSGTPWKRKLKRQRPSGSKLRKRYRERVVAPSDSDEFERRLIWIFGSPRTGSTWLLRLLWAHGDVATLNETYLPTHLVPPGLASPDGEYLQRGIRADNPNYFFARPYLPDLLPELRELILRQLDRQLRAVGVGDLPKWILIKEPNGSHAADTVFRIVPEGRMIFVLRDGRDVLDSLADAMLRQRSWWRASSDRIAGGRNVPQQRLTFVRQQARMWVQRVTAVQRAFNQLSEDRRLLVRYEKLLVDTTAELRRIHEWLELPFSEDDLRATVEREGFDRIPAERRGPGKGARAASPGLWRENFAPQEQELMGEIMGPKLRELGYE